MLTIGVGPTFAMRWLIPRLADFRKSAPDIDVRITTGGAAAPFSDDWTCGIQLGDGDWPGLVAEPLFAADLTPVCAPRLAAALKRPGDLKGRALLRVAHAPEDWPRWLKAAGVAGITARGPEFDYLRPRAAGGGRRPRRRDGHPALYRRRSRRRPAGRAVRATVPKGMRWYLVYRAVRAEQRDFAAFRGWIMRAATMPAARRKSGSQKSQHM